MKMIVALLLTVVAVALGCQDSRREETDQHDHTAAPQAQFRPAGTPDNLLVIDPEMLRDLRITTALVEARTGGENVTMLGELRVNEDTYAEVGSPIAARVLQVLVSLGETVRPGLALAELQSVELGKARAEYLAAKARRDLAQHSVQRKRSLAEERIVPQRELQEAEAEASAAKATLQAARAALRALGAAADDLDASGAADTSRFQLRSPIAGTIIERSIARGQVADPAHPLFRIADLSRLWLTVHAFERDAVRVKVGTATRATFPALPGRTFSGTVTLVGSQVDLDSRTIPVRIELTNPEGLLRPGMSAAASVPLDAAAGLVLAVPAAALQRLQDGWVVFLPRAEDRFEIRPVGRGRDLGGEVEIVSGLQAGETAVVEGAFLLKGEAEKSRGEGEHHEH
jgi:cobalt-zinc-cadmium efflux system membrane fusion protein